MSTHINLRYTAECTCEQATMCADTRPGHSLHAMQLRLAAATPSAWRDAIVVATSADGWVQLATLDDADIHIWNHADANRVLTPGDPVSVHAQYNVLSAGSRRFNVLEDSEA